MSLMVELGSDKLPITEGGIEVLSCLANASPFLWYRRHPVIIKAWALRPDSSVKDANYRPLAKIRLNPSASPCKPKSQELV